MGTGVAWGGSVAHQALLCLASWLLGGGTDARTLKSKNTDGKFQGVQSFTKPVKLYDP